MAPRFLGKTSFDGLELVAFDGHPLLDDYARLRDLLEARAPAARGLFAEPVGDWKSGNAPVVSWYAEAANEPEALASIAPDRRLQLEAQLRSLMALLAPLLGEPATGPLLRLALVLPAPDAIKAVDGKIVLTDWGVVRAGTQIPADPLALSPLARYLPPVGAVPLRSHVQLQQAASPPPSPIAAISPRPIRSVWNWWLVPAGVVVAVLFLILGVWLGSRLVSERVAQQPTTVSLFDEASVRTEIDRQREQNAALERELSARRRALSGDVCKADPAQMPQIGPDHAAVVPPVATPTPPGGQPFRGNLADLLTQGVVMILAPTRDGGAESGSGFFITPELIVTNRHVIDQAVAGKILVIGGKLPLPVDAELVASSPTSELGALDVALLRVPAVADVQPLTMSTAAVPLDPVVAAGFPGLTMQGDAAYHRLLEGDASAVPTVILTDGKISAVQTSPSGLKIMPHTAAVSGGNSGGPLVDACGRVVGLNTFITADQEQVAHANYAQKSDQIIDFLQRNQANPAVVNTPCAPAQPPAPAPNQSSSATPAAPAATPAAPAQAAPQR